jgi:hypothetical protein
MSMFSMTSASSVPAQVLGVVAHGEQAGVELGVQRLDAAVHDLRKAGEIVDRADVQAGGLELARGTPGRHDLDVELGQPTGEVDDAALVGDRQQGPPDANRPRLRQPFPGLCGGVLGDGGSIVGAPRVRAPDQGNTPANQEVQSIHAGANPD